MFRIAFILLVGAAIQGSGESPTWAAIGMLGMAIWFLSSDLQDAHRKAEQAEKAANAEGQKAWNLERDIAQIKRDAASLLSQVRSLEAELDILKPRAVGTKRGPWG